MKERREAEAETSTSTPIEENNVILMARAMAKAKAKAGTATNTEIKMGTKIVIKGSLPNLNNYIDVCRNNKYGAASFKKSVENKLMREIKAQLKEPLRGRCLFFFKWYERDRRRDPDNIAFAKKFIFDAMVKARLLPNDGWNEIAGFKDIFEVDKAKPRIEIEIAEDVERNGTDKGRT